jgi:hypothetical protein
LQLRYGHRVTHSTHKGTHFSHTLYQTTIEEVFSFQLSVFSFFSDNHDNLIDNKNNIFLIGFHPFRPFHPSHPSHPFHPFRPFHPRACVLCGHAKARPYNADGREAR